MRGIHLFPTLCGSWLSVAPTWEWRGRGSSTQGETLRSDFKSSLHSPHCRHTPHTVAPRSPQVRRPHVGPSTAPLPPAAVLTAGLTNTKSVQVRLLPLAAQQRKLCSARTTWQSWVCLPAHLMHLKKKKISDTPGRVTFWQTACA